MYVLIYTFIYAIEKQSSFFNKYKKRCMVNFPLLNSDLIGLLVNPRQEPKRHDPYGNDLKPNHQRRRAVPTVPTVPYQTNRTVPTVPSVFTKLIEENLRIKKFNLTI
ncbi:hypothetical protein BpHYR1_051116 [Brachionus plicatilis]|uniref:Uncharacterized protein n=1 Tax=Brachionus plicatilis TaxID=10195 RepID=A0A3M7PGK4_BRAPC|nr:hypothetical protein BpHYR1_051116 [Brachionus plicatilis]